MNEKYITLTRTYAAPREVLWRAWTTPDELAQWWAPKGFSNPVCNVDARVGGELYILMQAGDTLGPMSGMKAPLKGVFTEVVDGEKLAFTTAALNDAGEPVLEGTTTVTFKDEGAKTTLVVHTGAKGDAPGTDMMLGGMEQGWSEQLDKLGALVGN